MNQRNNGAWIEEVHVDPVTNIATAFGIGLLVPEIKHFNAIPIEEENAIRESRDWIILDDLGFAIKDVDGIHLTISAYWTGSSFILNTIFFNDRGLHVNGKGPQIDANCVTVFTNRNDLCVKELRKFGKMISEKSPDFEGYVNIDVVYSEGKLWYHGIRMAIYYDFLFAMSMLYNVSPDSLLHKMESDIPIATNFAATLRLYTYYFDTQLILEILDRHQSSAYIRTFDDGAVVVGTGENIKKAWNNLYANIPQSIIKDLDICYRNDGDEFSRDCFSRMREGGLI